MCDIFEVDQSKLAYSKEETGRNHSKIEFIIRNKEISILIFLYFEKLEIFIYLKLIQCKFLDFISI